MFQGFMPPMLVFVQSIERARELFHELVYEGINVDVIHAERTQQQVLEDTSHIPPSSPIRSKISKNNALIYLKHSFSFKS